MSPYNVTVCYLASAVRVYQAATTKTRLAFLFQIATTHPNRRKSFTTLAGRIIAQQTDAAI